MDKPPGPSEGQASSGWSDAWLTPRRFAGLLAGFIIAFFPDALLMGKSFVFRDFGIFTYPNALFQRESFWRGEFPLWNPLNNCGIPFLAQWNTTCLYPPALVYLLLPLTPGLAIFLLAHLLVAGLGMYYLARRWTGNCLAAGIAGVAFAFSGMTLNCLMWSSNLAALAWMPWVIFLVERASSGGGRRPIILAAFVAGLQMLAGAPEIIALTWLVILLFIREAQPAGRRRRGLLVIAVIGTLTLLLSAAQLLPFLDLLAHSDRTLSSGGDVWTVPTSGWANLFVPLFHCYRSPLGVYFQPWQDWTSSYYPGLGVLALAALAIGFIRVRRVGWLAVLAMLGFAVAMGDQAYVYPLLLKLFPPLGLMRYPIKFLFLTSFCLPLLAAFAVARVRASGADELGRWQRAVALVLVSIVAIVLGIQWYDHQYPLPNEDPAIVFHNGLVRLVFLGALFGGLVFYRRIQSARSQAVAGTLLLALVWGDLATHVPRQNPTVDASVFAPGLLASRMEPLPRAGESRALMTRQSHAVVYGSMLTNAVNDYLGRRGALFGDCNILDDIPVADGFYSLYLEDQRRLFEWFFWSPPDRFPAGLADFLGIVQMSDPQKMLQWQRRPSAMPFYSVGAQPVFMESSNAAALLLSPDFNPRKTVFLPVAAKAKIGPIEAGPATVREIAFAPRRMEFAVSAAGPGLLVLSQSYYHRWHAVVNGQTARIWRANEAFQAIEVPAGASGVTLVYRDGLFLTGAAISLVTLAACLAGWRRRDGID